MPDTWTGPTPEQMTEKLRGRARVQRGGGTYTSSEPTHMLLDEAADLIEWLAAKIDELELPRCGICAVPKPKHMHGCPIWHAEVGHIERLAAERDRAEWRAEIAHNARTEETT